MIKIKNYLTNLPKGVKILLYSNIAIYVLMLLLNTFISIDLINYFSVYTTNNTDKFHYYQIITSMFTHDYLIDHILFNMILFLWVSSNIEFNLGSKHLLVIYFLSGFICFLFSNHIISIKYAEFFKTNNHIEGYPSLEKMLYDINSYKHRSCGSSGAVCGLLMVYLLLNIANIKKILTNLFILFFLLINVVPLFQGNDNQLIGMYYAHVGGFVGGLIYFISYKLIEMKKEVQLRTS